MKPCLVIALVFALATNAWAQLPVYTVKPGVKAQQSLPDTGGKTKQTPRTTGGTPTGNVRTQVSIELFTGKEGVGLQVLEWQKVFQELNVPVQVRNGTLTDKPETTESTTGNVRLVKAVGYIDRSGNLIFAGRTFSPADAQKFGDWVGELSTYGSLGSPTGQPLWGLTQEQFADIFATLTAPLEGEVAGLPLAAALQKFAIPGKHKVREHVRAQAALKSRNDDAVIATELVGFSKGTALAVALNEFGLAFRPARNPDGSIDIEIVVLDDVKEIWPTGWEPKQSRPEIAPQLFQMLPIELDGVGFIDVLSAISDRASLHFLIDRRTIAARGIDLDNLKVSFPPKKSTYSLLLKNITMANRLEHQLKVDEQGRVFVWITALVPAGLGK